MRLEALHPIQCYVSDGLYVQPAILRFGSGQCAQFGEFVAGIASSANSEIAASLQAVFDSGVHVALDAEITGMRQNVAPGVGVNMVTVREPVPVIGLAANFSSIPRIAPPPFGRLICGGVNGEVC